MLPLFADLSPEGIARLDRATRMLACRLGLLLSSANDPDEAVLIFKQGDVQLLPIAPEGKKLILARGSRVRSLGKWLPSASRCTPPSRRRSTITWSDQ